MSEFQLLLPVFNLLPSQFNQVHAVISRAYISIRFLGGSGTWRDSCRCCSPLPLPPAAGVALLSAAAVFFRQPFDLLGASSLSIAALASSPPPVQAEPARGMRAIVRGGTHRPGLHSRRADLQLSMRSTVSTMTAALRCHVFETSLAIVYVRIERV